MDRPFILLANNQLFRQGSFSKRETTPLLLPRTRGKFGLSSAEWCRYSTPGFDLPNRLRLGAEKPAPLSEAGRTTTRCLIFSAWLILLHSPLGGGGSVRRVAERDACHFVRQEICVYRLPSFSVSGVTKMRDRFVTFLSHTGSNSAGYSLGGVVALPWKQTRFLRRFCSRHLLFVVEFQGVSP